MIPRSLVVACLLAGTLSGEELAIGERAYIASKIYALVQQNFAHWEAVPNLDWDAAYREYLDRALASADRRAFDFATMELVARLQNGHTSFYDDWLYRQDGAALGFRLVYMGEKWVVKRSDIPALRSGDVLSAIDGVPIEQYYQQQRKYIWASNEQSSRSRFSAVSVWFPQRFKVTLDNGDAIAIERGTLRGRIGSQTTTQAKSEGRWLEGDRAAYIRIPSFGQPGYEASAIELVGKFKGASSIVIDVRGNGGGSTPTGLIEALMDKPYRSWREATAIQISAFHAQGLPPSTFSWQSESSPAGKAAYHGRVLILIDRECGSACEDFVMPFKDNRRATIVGETTVGSSGQPRFVDFGNGMSFRVGAKREFFPDGAQFEGVGVAPDLPVAWRTDELRNGEDPVLKMARELALR